MTGAPEKHKLVVQIAASQRWGPKQSLLPSPYPATPHPPRLRTGSRVLAGGCDVSKSAEGKQTLPFVLSLTSRPQPMPMPLLGRMCLAVAPAGWSL